jgi:hypothetical protein
MKLLRSAVRTASALTLIFLLGACSGSSSDPETSQIQGVATPSNIAVVTATNAE